MRRREGIDVRIALFTACFNDALLPRTAIAVVDLLERLGHEVTFDAAQTCCGQIHWTAGYRPETLALARRLAGILGDHEIVVTPSASCAAMVRNTYPRLAEDDPPLAAALTRSESGGVPIYELSELLVDVLGVTDVGAYFPYRVTYHPTCHSLRGLEIGDRPVRLLRGVRDLDLVELPDAEVCCGFGGAFAVKNADTSVAMVADKLRGVRDTGADVVCAADNSCLLHIGGALSRQRSGTRTLHLAEILACTDGRFP